jgi:lipopolysaccharide biosynthesis glycosyltransferase
MLAYVLAIGIVGLLLAQYFMPKENKQTKTLDFMPTYDFALKPAPQNCNNVSGDVNLVLITDANYMDFTRVAMKSAIETKCPNSKYNFYVMTMNVSDKDVSALKALETKDVTVEVLPQGEVDLFYIRDTHVSKTSLLKYYIAKVLPNLDKVLYVDSDILVLHDLNSIYKTDITGKYLAAVKDPSWFFENMHVVELNLDYRGFYFNSGVMLMNLKKIRDDNLLAKLEDYTNNNFRTYMDQDALNVVVENDVVLLPVEANTMNFFFEHNDMKTLGNFYNRDWKSYEDVFANATILHFASSKKPLGALADKFQFFRMLQEAWYSVYNTLPPL